MNSPDTRARRGILGRTAREVAYVLGSIPFAVVGAVVVLVPAVLGIALSPVVAGLSLLTLAASAAGWFAGVERGMQHRFLGVKIPARTTGTALLQDRQAWLDIVWALLRALVAALTTAVTLVWLGLAAAVLITPAEILLPELYPEHFFRFGTWTPSDRTVWTVKRSGFCSESEQGESEYVQEVQSGVA